MAPRKLSDSDKSTIVELYKQPGQTTSTLAEQYGVSNSTISRILKLSMPAADYRALVSQKRMGGGVDKASANAEDTKTPAKRRQRRSRKSITTEEAVPASSTHETTAGSDFEPSTLLDSEPVGNELDSPDLVDEAAERTSVAPPKLKTTAEKEAAKSKPPSSSRRRRRRSDSAASLEEDEQLPLLAEDNEIPTSQPLVEDDDDDEDDLLGLDETLGDDFGDDADELDEDIDDEELDEDETSAPKPKLQVKTAIQIMPLGEAVLPKPCYLVIDMRSELITRPLIEFADLGQVPSEEERAKTLPVFDNHRVARRFSRNKQRVIKVPDGSLITRTSPYLAAKGITRLLVDGQVFDLASSGIKE
ncbi:MAG: hypothetical protein AB8B99_05340 [Phormidesmis sp.]